MVTLQPVDVLSLKTSPPAPMQLPVDREACSAIVSELVASAAAEELSGCFGIAEVYLRKAWLFAVSHFPTSKQAARVARDFGLFLGRFLEDSVQPAYYLRQSLSIELALDPRSSDAVSCLLLLSKALMDIEEFTESETLLQTVLTAERDQVTTARARAYCGRMVLLKGDVLKAEQLLRESVDTIRSLLPGSEELAEALVCLSQAMHEKEYFEECLTLALEAVSILKQNPQQQFFKALSIVAQCYCSLCQSDRMESYFNVLIEDLRRSSVSPYIIPKVLTTWGDTHYSFAETGLRYLQALNLYRDVRPESCYVATVLSKLLCYFTRSTCNQWKENLARIADRELTALARHLPCIPTVAHTFQYSPEGTSSHFAICEQLKAVAASDCDELTRGEALLQLFRLSPDCSDWSLVETFEDDFPQSSLLAALYSKAREDLRKELKALDLHRAKPDATRDYFAVLHSLSMKKIRSFTEALQLVQEVVAKSKERAHRAWNTVQQLRKLAFVYKFNGCLEEGASTCIEAASLACSINPDAAQCISIATELAAVLLMKNHASEAEIGLRTAVDRILRQRKSLRYSGNDAVQKLLELYISTQQYEKANSLIDEILVFLRSLPRLSAVEQRLLLSIGLSARDSHRMKELILLTTRVRTLSDAYLNQERELFYGHTVGVFSSSPFVFNHITKLQKLLEGESCEGQAETVSVIAFRVEMITPWTRRNALSSLRMLYLPTA